LPVSKPNLEASPNLPFDTQDMDSSERKQLLTLIQRSFDAQLTPAEQKDLRDQLRDDPAAMDCYLEHCQMEAWLSAAELQDAPPAGKICELDTEAEPVATPAESPKTLPGWTNWLGLAAMLVLFGGMLNIFQAPLPEGDGLAEATEVSSRPERDREDLDPEEAKAWKTLIASTGSDKHPPVMTENVPESKKQSNQPVRFNRDIRPILSETCFHCHGPDEEGRRADLRLDVVEATKPDKDGWQPIVPGDADASEVWYRIITDDKDELMPPPESHMELTAEQKQLLKRWIEEGAEYEGHWAFETPRDPVLPENKLEWGNNEIDTFILARLEEQGLQPSPEADRRTLARRLYLDLTGLPPSADEMHAFLADTSPDAYETLVDQLLDSSHYGERMALQWLDQARYADTNGYSIDGGRHMWLWRDYVINAYNANMPFDQFTIEQLAGDLLPNPTQDQLVATGFNRNHMITHEGGTIPEENLMNYVADRVKTTSEVFLGLTMACAQCHDHKYDPISQRDYYRFYAYFNTIEDKGLDGNAGRNSMPNIMAATSLPHNAEPVRRRLKTAKADLAKPRPGMQRAWEAEVKTEFESLGKELLMTPVEVIGAKTPNRNAEVIGFEDGNTVVMHGYHRQAITVSAKLPEGAYEGLRVVFEPSEEAEGFLGFGQKEEKGGFFISGISASSGQLPSDEIDLYGILPIKEVTASQTAEGMTPRNVMDERSDLIWTTFPEVEKPQHLTLRLEEPVKSAESEYITLMINFVNTASNTRGANAARMKIYAYTGHDDGTNYPEELRELLTVAEADRSPEQKAKIGNYFRELAPALEPLRVRIANYERRLQDMTEEHSVMVMNTAEKPRITHILHRGDYASPTDPVTAGTPEVLPTLIEKEDEAEYTRLDLAHCLVDPEHPLTARVTVNRYWQMFFGTGLVSTSADFGSQGEWPSHPELLDWLAIQFRESGWDTKAMLRLMVTSATYKQTSNISEELRLMDPGNRLLARGPRFRLQAEFIRDAALKSSGLLVPWIGGSSVNPGQPPNLWKEVSHFGSTPATAQVHVEDEGLDRHRRSLYTFWKRTVPPPNMAAFDAPNREVCVMQRSITNTPLQALVMLNDPHFVEASDALGRRMEQIAQKETPQAGIEFGFEEVLGRLPHSKELEELMEAYTSQRDWRFIGQLLLNLSETITKS